MHDTNHSCCTPCGVSRRKFLTLATLAGGVSLLTAVLPKPAQAAGHAEALLLSCMDYRLVDDTERYMSERGLRDKYDHVVLAGAALGALTDKFPAWNKAFWDHLGVAIDLHHVGKVIVLDHRDCGAYKVVLGKDFGKDRAAETDAHAGQLRELRRRIKERHPKLEVELLLMALDGSVENIA